MPLKVPSALKFDQRDDSARISGGAIRELLALARKIDGISTRALLETLKASIARQSGQEYYSSSSADWAETDLWRIAEAADGHEFLAGLYNTFEDLSGKDLDVPDADHINAVLSRNDCPYRIQGDQLLLTAEHVEAPEAPLAPTSVVTIALRDARTLLGQSGASSAVDRLHTALHGYLRHLCLDAQIDVPEDATVAGLFKSLRQGHPALEPTGPRAEEVGRIVRAFASVIDSLSTIRNKATLAHPNQLLEEPEAVVVINASHTVFRYVQDCIERHSA